MGASTSPDQAAVVTDAIQKLSHIATLPEITIRIIELVEDRSEGVVQIHGAGCVNGNGRDMAQIRSRRPIRRFHGGQKLIIR